MPGFHHLELWVADLESARAEWGWLLERVGFEFDGAWPEGSTWTAGSAYLTITTSPNLAGETHDRRQPGLNHIALWGGTRGEVDAVMAEASDHGWKPLYHERYPHAGGPDHYAGWIENSAGFKAEIVAGQPS